MSRDPRDLDPEIAAVFQSYFGGGVRAANERAAAEHLNRRFETGPKLSESLWGAGDDQREAIIDYLRGEYRRGAAIGETPGYPPNKVRENLRTWYEDGPSQGQRGDPTYVARRLANTEAAFYFQALDNAVDERLEDAGLIDGYDILLAPEREDWDCQCPEIADGSPYPTLAECPEPPFHPLCMCRRRPRILTESKRTQEEAEKHRAWDAERFAKHVLTDLAIHHGVGVIAEIVWIIRHTEKGSMFQYMVRELYAYYTGYARETMRQWFRGRPRVEVTVQPELQPALPSGMRELTAPGVARREAEALKRRVERKAPPERPPAPDLTPEEFDQQVRDLLREAIKEGKPTQGPGVFRSETVTMDHESQIVDQLFARGVGPTTINDPRLPSIWKKDPPVPLGQRRTEIGYRITRQPGVDPGHPGAWRITTSGGRRIDGLHITQPGIAAPPGRQAIRTSRGLVLGTIEPLPPPPPGQAQQFILRTSNHRQIEQMLTVTGITEAIQRAVAEWVPEDIDARLEQLTTEQLAIIEQEGIRRLPRRVVARVWPVSAVTADELGFGEDTITIPPGASLRPFAVTTEAGDQVIELREMPSWEHAEPFADSQIRAFIDPAAHPQLTMAAYRRVFPIAPAEVAAHLLFDTDQEVTGMRLAGTASGALRFELTTTDMRFVRTFHPTAQGVRVTHDEMRVAPEKQGKGLGRQVLVNAVYLYEALGYRDVQLWASREHGDIGAMVWAQFGFTPASSEWATLRNEYLLPWLHERRDTIPHDDYVELERLLSITNPRAIWAIASSPYGRQALLHGRHSGWLGFLNLSDAESMRRFGAYTERMPLVRAQRLADIEDEHRRLEPQRMPIPPGTPLPAPQPDDADLGWEITRFWDPWLPIDRGAPAGVGARRVWRAMFPLLAPKDAHDGWASAVMLAARPGLQRGPRQEPPEALTDVEHHEVYNFSIAAISNAGWRENLPIRPGVGFNLQLGTVRLTAQINADDEGRRRIIVGVANDRAYSLSEMAAVHEAMSLWAAHLGISEPVQYSVQDQQQFGHLLSLGAQPVAETPDYSSAAVLLGHLLSVLEPAIRADDPQSGRAFYLDQYNQITGPMGTDELAQLPLLHAAAGYKFGDIIARHGIKQMTFPRDQHARQASHAAALSLLQNWVTVQLPLITEPDAAYHQGIYRADLTQIDRAMRMVEARLGRPTAPGEPEPEPTAAPEPGSIPIVAHSPLPQGYSSQEALGFAGAPATRGPSPAELAAMRTAWVTEFQGTTKDELDHHLGTDFSDHEVERWNEHMGMTGKQWVEWWYAHLPPELVGTYSFDFTWHGDDHLEFNIRADGGDFGGIPFVMDRTVDFDSATAHHNRFEFMHKGRVKDGGKAAFRALIGLYEHWSIDTIELGAGMTMGGYAWPRYGFLADSGTAQDFAKRLIDHLHDRDSDIEREVSEDNEFIEQTEREAWGKLVYLFGEDFHDHDEAVLKELTEYTSLEADEAPAEFADYSEGVRDRLIADLLALPPKRLDQFDPRTVPELDLTMREVDKLGIYAERTSTESALTAFQADLVRIAIEDRIEELKQDDDHREQWYEDRAHDERLTRWGTGEPELLWEVADHPSGRDILAGTAYNLDMYLPGDQGDRLFKYIGYGDDRQEMFDAAERLFGVTTFTRDTSGLPAVTAATATQDPLYQPSVPDPYPTTGWPDAPRDLDPLVVDQLRRREWADTVSAPGVTPDTRDRIHRKAVDIARALQTTLPAFPDELAEFALRTPGVPPKMKLARRMILTATDRAQESIAMLGVQAQLPNPLYDPDGTYTTSRDLFTGQQIMRYEAAARITRRGQERSAAIGVAASAHIKLTVQEALEALGHWYAQVVAQGVPKEEITFQFDVHEAFAASLYEDLGQTSRAPNDPIRVRAEEQLGLLGMHIDWAASPEFAQRVMSPQRIGGIAVTLAEALVAGEITDYEIGMFTDAQAARDDERRDLTIEALLRLQSLSAVRALGAMMLTSGPGGAGVSWPRFKLLPSAEQILPTPEPMKLTPIHEPEARYRHVRDPGQGWDLAMQGIADRDQAHVRTLPMVLDARASDVINQPGVWLSRYYDAAPTDPWDERAADVVRKLLGDGPAEASGDRGGSIARAQRPIASFLASLIDHQRPPDQPIPAREHWDMGIYAVRAHPTEPLISVMLAPDQALVKTDNLSAQLMDRMHGDLTLAQEPRDDKPRLIFNLAGGALRRNAIEATSDAVAQLLPILDERTWEHTRDLHGVLPRVRIASQNPWLVHEMLQLGGTMPYRAWGEAIRRLRTIAIGDMHYSATGWELPQAARDRVRDVIKDLSDAHVALSAQRGLVDPVGLADLPSFLHDPTVRTFFLTSLDDARSVVTFDLEQHGGSPRGPTGHTLTDFQRLLTRRSEMRDFALPHDPTIKSAWGLQVPIVEGEAEAYPQVVAPDPVAGADKLPRIAREAPATTPAESTAVGAQLLRDFTMQERTPYTLQFTDRILRGRPKYQVHNTKSQTLAEVYTAELDYRPPGGQPQLIPFASFWMNPAGSWTVIMDERLPKPDVAGKVFVTEEPTTYEDAVAQALGYFHGARIMPHASERVTRTPFDGDDTAALGDRTEGLEPQRMPLYRGGDQTLRQLAVASTAIGQIERLELPTHPGWELERWARPAAGELTYRLTGPDLKAPRAVRVTYDQDRERFDVHMLDERKLGSFKPLGDEDGRLLVHLPSTAGPDVIAADMDEALGIIVGDWISASQHQKLGIWAAARRLLTGSPHKESTKQHVQRVIGRWDRHAQAMREAEEEERAIRIEAGEIDTADFVRHFASLDTLGFTGLTDLTTAAQALRPGVPTIAVWGADVGEAWTIKAIKAMDEELGFSERLSKGDPVVRQRILDHFAMYYPHWSAAFGSVYIEEDRYDPAEYHPFFMMVNLEAAAASNIYSSFVSGITEPAELAGPETEQQVTGWVGRWGVSQSVLGSFIHEHAHLAVTPVLWGLFEKYLYRGDDSVMTPTMQELLDHIAEYLDDVSASIGQYPTAERAKAIRRLMPSDYVFAMYEHAAGTVARTLTGAGAGDITSDMATDYRRLVDEIIAESVVGMMLDHVYYERAYPKLAQIATVAMRTAWQALGNTGEFPWPTPGSIEYQNERLTWPKGMMHQRDVVDVDESTTRVPIGADLDLVSQAVHNLAHTVSQGADPFNVETPGSYTTLPTSKRVLYVHGRAAATPENIARAARHDFIYAPLPDRRPPDLAPSADAGISIDRKTAHEAIEARAKLPPPDVDPALLRDSREAFADEIAQLAHGGAVVIVSLPVTPQHVIERHPADGIGGTDTAYTELRRYRDRFPHAEIVHRSPTTITIMMGRDRDRMMQAFYEWRHERIAAFSGGQHVPHGQIGRAADVIPLALPRPFREMMHDIEPVKPDGPETEDEHPIYGQHVWTDALPGEELEPTDYLPILYHGTTKKNAMSIRETGLKPQAGALTKTVYGEYDIPYVDPMEASRIPGIATEDLPRRTREIVESERYLFERKPDEGGRVRTIMRPRHYLLFESATRVMRDDAGDVLSERVDYYDEQVLTASLRHTMNFVEPRYSVYSSDDWSEVVDNFAMAADAGMMYRGMSWEEWEDTVRRGYIESKGSMNIGRDQEGLTYYATTASEAAWYASAGAGVRWKPAIGMPAVVVGVPRRAGEHVPGTGEGEIGYRGRIGIDEIRVRFEGHLLVTSEGELDLIINPDGTYEDGSMRPPATGVYWTHVPSHMVVRDTPAHRAWEQIIEETEGIPRLGDLVFFASADEIRKAIGIMERQVEDEVFDEGGMGHMGRLYGMQEGRQWRAIYERGAMVVAADYDWSTMYRMVPETDEFIRADGEPHWPDHAPIQVESGDWFTEQPQPATDILTGADLLAFIARVMPLERRAIEEALGQQELFPGGVEKYITRELNQMMALPPGMRARAPEHQAQAIRQLGERLGRGDLPFKPSPVGPLVFQAQVPPEARIITLDDARALGQRYGVHRLPPDLAKLYSPQFLAMMLGFTAVQHESGYNVLDAAVLEPDHAAAIITGTRKALERVRTSHDDITFTYLAYR